MRKNLITIFRVDKSRVVIAVYATIVVLKIGKKMMKKIDTAKQK